MKKTIPGVAIVAAMRAKPEFDRQTRLGEVEHALKVELLGKEKELARLKEVMEEQGAELEALKDRLAKFLEGDEALASV